MKEASSTELRLRALHAKVDRMSTFSPSAGPTKRGPQVLVVDDDAGMGEFIRSAAQAMNIECVTTTRAQDFMAAFHADVSLVMVDLIMPDMDGVELLRWLAQQRCRAGVLLMSGMDRRVLETAESLTKSLGLKVVGHLQKPFRLAELELSLTSFGSPHEAVDVPINVAFRVTKEDLLRGINRDEFVLHYQPQVEVLTGHVVGLEALVRWEHPDVGMVYPDSFIGNAERFGLIDRLGWLVINRGLSESHQFSDNDKRPLTLSLNVSAHSLTDLEFPDKLIALTKKHGVAPENIILEITESGLFENLSSALDVLMRLRLKQVQLSIDDFGTGYAMMQQLRNVPATELKIDQSFIREMHQKDAARVVVRKTIEIGHELRMKVLAEGVETVEQLEFLRANQCDLAQGYYFCRPLPVPELLNWLKQF